MPRIRSYTAEGIVLRCSDFGEADRLVVLLTREHGKVRAIAKGVRRPTSRHAGNLEPFVQTRVQLGRGRELEVLTQSELTRPRRSLRESLESAAHAYYLTEVADAMVEPGASASRVFTLIGRALDLIDEGADPALTTVQAILHLLDLLGYRPQLLCCLGCDEELRPVPSHFSVAEGGALCPRCGAGRRSARPIAVDTLKLLRNLQRSPRLGEPRLTLPGTVVEPADRLVRGLVEYHLDHRLRSPRFIEQVREVDGPAVEVPRSEAPSAATA
jgi:DNA repair protein RecO (recombination protein O)